MMNGWILWCIAVTITISISVTSLFLMIYGNALFSPPVIKQGHETDMQPIQLLFIMVHRNGTHLINTIALENIAHSERDVEQDVWNDLIELSYNNRVLLEIDVPDRWNYDQSCREYYCHTNKSDAWKFIRIDKSFQIDTKQLSAINPRINNVTENEDDTISFQLDFSGFQETAYTYNRLTFFIPLSKISDQCFFAQDYKTCTMIMDKIEKLVIQ